jgi:hypothetical protein
MNVLLASMMIFAVSCGKDSKKKNNNSYPFFNNLQTPVQSSANLTQYLDGNETKTNLIGAVNVVKQRYSCSTKDFLGIDFLPYEKCSYSQISNQLYAQPGIPRKTLNPALAEILVPANGYTLGAVMQYGSIVTVDHVLNNGSTIETIQYTIDLNRHAASNPVIKKDTAAKRIDTVIYPSL